MCAHRVVCVCLIEKVCGRLCVSVFVLGCLSVCVCVCVCV